LLLVNKLKGTVQLRSQVVNLVVGILELSYEQLLEHDLVLLRVKALWMSSDLRELLYPLSF